MWHIGVDAHKVKCCLVAKDEAGRLVARTTFLHTPEGWRDALKDAPAGSKVAVECVGWYGRVMDLVEDLGLEPVLVHAKNVALIATSRKKTDRYDAGVLCDLLRTDFLPRAHIPSKEGRELRELTRHADDVVKRTTAIKNTIHRLLERAWVVEPDVTDLFGMEGRGFLETVPVSTAQRVVLDALLAEFDALQRVRSRLEHEVAKRVQDDADVDLLLGIDGLGVMGAATLKAEIDTVNRFPNKKTIRSNFGLATSVRNSADTERRGRITKQGPGVVRKVLVQGALHFARHNPNTSMKHARLAGKRGKGVARVAAAADLLDVTYQVLKTRTRYHHERRQRHAEKRRELARLARTPEPICVS